MQGLQYPGGNSPFTPPIPIGTTGNFDDASHQLHEVQLGAVRFLESEEGDEKAVGKLELKLIEAGKSKNNYFYSAEVAESVADFIKERPQLYMNHSWGWFGRGMEEVVAIAVESWKKDGAAYAIAEMAGNPNTQWIYEYAKRHPGQVGCSIDARAKVRESTAKDGHLWGDESFDPEVEGTPMVYIVEEIVFLNSVDFVTYPAAGGGVESIAASLQDDPETFKRYQKAMEAFNNTFYETEMAEQINSQTQEDHMDLKELTREALKANRPDLVQELADEIREAIQKEQAGQTAQDLQEQLDTANGTIEEFEGKMADLEGKLKEAERERDEAQAKVDEFQLKEEVQAHKAHVDQLIAESKLDEKDELQVSETFRKGLYKLKEDDDILEKIADRVALIEAAQKPVSGHGQRQDEDEEETVTEDEETPSYDTNRLVAELNA